MLAIFFLPPPPNTLRAYSASSQFAVRRLSEPDDGDGTESGWSRRRAFEAEAAAISTMAATRCVDRRT